MCRLKWWGFLKTLWTFDFGVIYDIRYHMPFPIFRIAINLYWKWSFYLMNNWKCAHRRKRVESLFSKIYFERFCVMLTSVLVIRQVFPSHAQHKIQFQETNSEQRKYCNTIISFGNEVTCAACKCSIVNWKLCRLLQALQPHRHKFTSPDKLNMVYQSTIAAAVLHMQIERMLSVIENIPYNGRWSWSPSTHQSMRCKGYIRIYTFACVCVESGLWHRMLPINPPGRPTASNQINISWAWGLEIIYNSSIRACVCLLLEYIFTWQMASALYQTMYAQGRSPNMSHKHWMKKFGSKNKHKFGQFV